MYLLINYNQEKQNLVVVMLLNKLLKEIKNIQQKKIILFIMITEQLQFLMKIIINVLLIQKILRLFPDGIGEN